MNYTHGILIGGFGNQTGSLIVNLDNFEMVEGPKLANNGRAEHACSSFTRFNGTNYVIVAGGFDGENDLNTTELINVEDLGGGWFQGK